MNMKKSVFVLFSLCLALSCDASVWPAVWIGCHAEKSGADLRVAYFRKSAQLNTVPDGMPIGSPLRSNPHGAEMPGSPARFTETV